jgi:competence protein ComEA
MSRQPIRQPIRQERPDRSAQAAAVARRLDLLDQELAGVRRNSPGLPPDHTPATEPSTHLSTHLSTQPSTQPSTVPLPGRHAARRSRSPAGSWVPEPLRGHVALGPGPLAVVAVVVALGLAATAWWTVRSEPVPVAPPEPVTAESPLATPATEALPEADPEEPVTVTVDVTGRVRHPGIVVLETGARVVDALREAGGARPGADLSGLNLARVLVDGEQVVVGVPPPVTGLPATSPTTSPGAPGTALVDLNTADLALLESLPEVGPVTAQAILTWREEHGGFTAVTELLEVDGIGDATLATITPFVTV